MDRSSASDASPGNSGSVATLTGLTAARFPPGPNLESLFAGPATGATNDWARHFSSAYSPPTYPRRMNVLSPRPEGMIGSIRTNNSHFGSHAQESPSAFLSEEAAHVPSAADLMPGQGAPSRRARKRTASDPPSEASFVLPPMMGRAPSTASTATIPHHSSAQRVSARIRRPPVDFDDLVCENRSRKRKTPPDGKTPSPMKRARLKADPDEDVNTEHDSTCCICMTEPEHADLASINGCEHMFCFGCIEKWADRENTCPLCKQRFTKIDRVNKTKKKAAKSSKKVKNRDQRSEMSQTIALEGLFGEFARSGFHIESIFSRMAGSNVNTHIARIVFNGIGHPGSGHPGSVFEAHPLRAFQSPRTSVPASVPGPEVAGMLPRLENVLEDSLFGSDDEDSEDEGYNGFVASIRNMESMRGGPIVFGSGQSGRSFASNIHDADAGGTADNALEIEDDSDDEVEVVHVSRGNNL